MEGWLVPFYTEAFFSIQRFYSWTNSFVRIEPVWKELNCGLNKLITVHYILNKKQYRGATSVNFFYLVSNCERLPGFSERALVGICIAECQTAIPKGLVPSGCLVGKTHYWFAAVYIWVNRTAKAGRGLRWFNSIRSAQGKDAQHFSMLDLTPFWVIHLKQYSWCLSGCHSSFPANGSYLVISFYN